jgi:formate dehydrogenase subunit gamma
MTRWTLPALLMAALLALPLSAAAQEPEALEDPVEAEVGGGLAPSTYASPGLETRTPGSIDPETFDLYGEREQLVGRVTIPDDKLSVLVQPEGRDWRAFRIQWLFWIAAGVILLTVAGLAGFYLWRGRLPIESGRSGRWVPRFNAVERFAHWATALSFITLALTGLIVTFGRWLLIPIIGHGAFTPTAEVAKSLHNFSAIPFVVGILLMLVLWIRDNIPNRADLDWIRHGGGMFTRTGSYHPETARFNAGQKGIFWAVVLGGLLLAVSGYILMAPFIWVDVNGMQVAHAVHGILAVLLIAVILAHIYLGTLGMEGAFDAMGRGEVDENWAREHHRGWYEAKAKHKVRTEPGRPGVPAE